MKLTLWLILLASLCIAPRGFAQSTAAPVAGAQAGSAPVFSKDMTLYVRDFELDAENVKVDSGGVIGNVRPGIIERPSKRAEHDPEAQAKKLVDTMSRSLIKDLEKAGYKVERLGLDDPAPTSGAMVSGVFTEVDEGNRLHRAVIGFGSGSANMELYVTLSDLAHPEKPLYNAARDDTSGKKPGAVITLNPYVAAAKFVMEKNAPEKTVKKTASQISKEVESHLENATPPSQKS
jgi:hypothetical protein